MGHIGHWADLTALEFAALDREHAVAILPIGAIEQSQKASVPTLSLAGQLALTGPNRRGGIANCCLEPFNVQRSTMCLKCLTAFPLLMDDQKDRCLAGSVHIIARAAQFKPRLAGKMLDGCEDRFTVAF